MKERQTARLLLFDESDRLLLMKVDDSSVTDPKQPSRKSPFWVTLGGEIEPLEDVFAAARRELFEETGLKNAVWGPAVWYGEQELIWKGEPTVLKETFIVAKTDESQISDQFRTVEERQVMVAVKWWHYEEIAQTNEIILPGFLTKNLGVILSGHYPSQIIHISLAG